MKSKFSIALLVGVTAIAYASTNINEFETIHTSLKKIVLAALPKQVRIANKSYGKVTTCGVSTRLLNAVPENWSNPSAWAGGVVPTGGNVVIPADKHIILDLATVNLSSLTINGTLEFARQNINLTAGWIMVSGKLEVGTETIPFTNKAIITLNAVNMDEQIMNMGTRGIMVMGGKLELHGTPPAKTYTKLNNNASAGATSLTLLDAVSWNVNDQIVVSPTDYYTDVQYNAPAVKSMAQRTQITSINGTTLNIQDGLNAQRWGKLQYLTTTGMSLTPGTLPANISPGTPTVLDERGEVANLTRNIVIQSVDDALWQNNGFGCHIMIMRMNGIIGEAHINGIEIKRGGQAGKLGRYPFHWHMLSYEGATTLSDATGQYIRNSTVNQSTNRGIVIHGTNGTEVKNNVVYDVLGHGIFFENASERRNIIDGNMVLKVRAPSEANLLKIHEGANHGVGSSGYWISNPDNTMINNTAADCKGSGFWLAFPTKCFGPSKDVPLIPNRMKFGTFNNNHTHSNGQLGIMLDDFEMDEEGNTTLGMYMSTSDMKEPEWPLTTLLQYELADYTTWKNNGTGIWNRSKCPMNRRAVNADNSNQHFSGSASKSANPANDGNAFVEKSLVVGTSLNHNMNGFTDPPHWSAGPRSAFQSYHSDVDIINNVVVNFPAVADKQSGYISLHDYYIRPVDKGNTRNVGNILINTHAGVRTKPPLTQHVYGVLWDNHNYTKVAEESQDNYYVFDEPFFTYGQTPQIVAPGTATSGAVIVRGPFYGFVDFWVNGTERTYDKIAISRTNAAEAVVGNWIVEEGAQGDLLGNMRHFATHPTGYYYLDFPNINNVNDFVIKVDNMLTTDDYQVLSVEYSGKYSITQLFASNSYDMGDYGITKPFPTGQSNVSSYTAVFDFQSVVNAPTGEVFWQDKINNKVWFKVRGGFNSGDPNVPANHDVNLYKAFKIRGYGTLQALPVTLTSFKGILTNKGNQLNWETTSEQNNSGFEIERSADGKVFEKITTIKGAGTTNAKQFYNYLDKTSPFKTTYYRLKQIDFDGKFEYSDIIAIKSNLNTKVVVYPNPFTSEISVSLDEILKPNTKIYLYDMFGRTHNVDFTLNGNIINCKTNNLPRGSYVLKIVTNVAVFNKVVIKN